MSICANTTHALKKTYPPTMTQTYIFNFPIKASLLRYLLVHQASMDVQVKYSLHLCVATEPSPMSQKSY
jgi:hypothetical protein